MMDIIAAKIAVAVALIAGPCAFAAAFRREMDDTGYVFPSLMVGVLAAIFSVVASGLIVGAIMFLVFA